ncbi:MAG TPA: type VI secretion system tube protein Hcp [Rudaea sp.]|nr:type VI secretion system tube protein Hcp [Rudaea sp.]
MVAQVLEEARASDIAPLFNAYASADPEHVYRQVWAIWDVLSRRAIRYSSANPAIERGPHSCSQRVRSLAQTWLDRSANCIDGSVRIASVLQRIGVRSFLVLVPCHAFIGFYTDADAQHAAYLETNLLGARVRPLKIPGFATDIPAARAFGIKAISKRRGRPVCVERFDASRSGGWIFRWISRRGAAYTGAGSGLAFTDTGAANMTRPIKGLWFFLLSLLGFYSSAAVAASAAVLCNTDIKGDSQATGAAGCIDVLAWSWGLSSQVTTGAKGSVLSPATFKEFTFTKSIDSSSDDLLRFASVHTPPISGTVEFREYMNCGTGCDSTTPYLTIRLLNVQVSSLSTGNSSGSDLDTESISLIFNKVSYCYQTQSKGSPQCFAFDLTTNSSMPPF